MITVNYVKTHPLAKEPTYATDGSGCFDLYALEPLNMADKVEEGSWENIYIFQDEERIFDTGIIFEIPRGYVMKIYSRSGQGFNHSVKLLNSTGIIDSDFRGSLKIGLRKDKSLSGGREDYKVSYGDRIAQAIILPFPKISFQEVVMADLSKTSRGAGGFGSTGA